MAQQETERVYEELLVVLVQAGDRRAAERLAARWHPRLLRTAKRMLQDEDLAREAVQDTWAGLLRGAARLTDPTRFPAWAFSILHRRCVDLVRKSQRSRRQAAALEPTTPQPGAAAVSEDQTAIQQAFGRLSLEHRAAALLYFGEGLTLYEVALATGVPVGTAKSRIFYARQQLKAALKGDDDGPV